MKQSHSVAGKLVKNLWHDYCNKPEKINGPILLDSCIQYYLLFDQQKLGSLKDYPFTQNDEY